MLQWHCIPTVRQRLRLINKILKKEKKYTIHHRYGGDPFPSFFFIFIYSLCMYVGAGDRYTQAMAYI